MNSTKKQKNLTLILSIKKYHDESKCHTILLFIKDVIKKGLAAGVANFKVYLLPDVVIPINEPSKFIKNSDNKSLIFDKLNDVKHGGGYRDLSGAHKLVEYDTNTENFFILFADERVIIPYGLTLPTPDKGLISSVLTVKVKNQENHYYHKLSEYGFNNIFLINDFKDLDVGFEPLKKGSFLSNLFSSEKKIDISMSELLTVEESEEQQLRDIARMNEQSIEYSGFTNKIFNFDSKLVQTFLRKSTSSASNKSDNSDKKINSASDFDNMISPSKSEDGAIRDFTSESPLLMPNKQVSEPITPVVEEFKMDSSSNLSDMKKSAESDTNIVKKASSPNSSIISENQSVSPPSTNKSQNSFQNVTSFLEPKKIDTPSANENSSSGDDALIIWDNKLDFVKSNIKGLPSKSEHINLSDFLVDGEYNHSIIIVLLNQFGALGREKEELCNNLLKKFDKKLKLAYISLDSKNPSLDLVYSDKKKVESVRALYSKIKDKFAMEAKEATKLNSFLSNMLSNKK